MNHDTDEVIKEKMMLIGVFFVTSGTLAKLGAGMYSVLGGLIALVCLATFFIRRFQKTRREQQAKEGVEVPS